MAVSPDPTLRTGPPGITWSDGAVAAAALGLYALTAWLASTRDGEPAFTAAGALVLVCGSLPLVVRRRHPIVAWLAAGVSAAIYGIADWPDPLVPFAAFVALVAVFEYCQRRTALVLIVISAVVAVAATAAAKDSDALDWGVTLMTLVVAPVLGELLRDRRAKFAALQARNESLRRDRDRAIEDARVAERRQVARELHDVVTHHVTMLVVQAEAAASARVMEDADRIATFDSLASTGRDALIELRQLLGVLRDPGERAPAGPVPGICHIAELVGRTRATGLEVDYRAPDVNGSIPTAVDLAAYRVVQEGLTNVVKHARAHRAVVSIAIDNSDIEVEVTDDGVGSPGTDGVGITGLRERIGLLGGTIDAAPQPLGGFRLYARIPLGVVR